MNTAVTVSSQLLRALRLLHNCQLTVLVYAPSTPHRGVDNARPVPFDLPSVPENPRQIIHLVSNVLKCDYFKQICLVILNYLYLPMM